MRTETATGRQRGFSLVELMVAMTVTLIVSAAIYGLITSGSNAFQREPELADRQQNARMAMDLIARDVFNAGAALPTFAQVFTRDEGYASNPGPCTGTGGVNGCGIEGMLGPAAADARAEGDGGDDSENTDVLEIVSIDERCPVSSLCSQPPGSPRAGEAGLFVTFESVPACQQQAGLALLTDNLQVSIQPATVSSGGPAACPIGGSAARNGNLVLGSAVQPWVPAAMPGPANDPPPSTPAIFVYRARVARYRIAPSGDPQDDMPALWRSETGRYTTAGAVAVEPGESGFPGPNSPWELVARGIEDLQIEYMAGDDVWRSQPPLSLANQWNTLVRNVRITISARAAVQGNQQGQTVAPGGTAPNAVRGQLTTTVAPRAAFNELQMGSQIQ
jgi:prepilin-type N-terminal cleavage/methylation domain-containing protein